MRKILSIDRVSGKLLIPIGEKKMYKGTYRRDSMENPEGFTPTFYGVDRKERLENHLTKVSDDSLPFSEVVNGGAEVEQAEDGWRRRNGQRE